MAVFIHGDLNPGLFDGVTAAYFDGTAVTLQDCGGTIIVGGDLPVAPTITRQPSILPQTAAVGDSITLDLGAAQGSPTPVITWDVTLNGTSIKSRLDTDAMTIELSEAGVYALTVRWTNSTDTVEANAASLTVAAPPIPSIPYATVALAYIDATTAFSGTDDDVSTITASGTGQYVFTKTGTGAAIQHNATGFVFGNGAYVQTQVLSNQPTTDGLFAVADLTLTSYGANVGQIIDGTGLNLKLRNSSGALQVLGPVSGQGTLALGNVTYGHRIVVGGQIDDVLDLLSGVAVSGAAVSMPHNGLVDPLPTRFTTGRYVNGTLHRLVIVGRAEGQAWPVTIEQVYADFRRGA